RFKTVTPKEFEEPKRPLIVRLIPVAAAVVGIALLAVLFLPALAKSKSKSSAMWSRLEPARLPEEVDSPVELSLEASRPTANEIRSPEQVNRGGYSVTPLGGSAQGVPVTAGRAASTTIVLPSSQELDYPALTTPLVPPEDGAVAFGVIA